MLIRKNWFLFKKITKTSIPKTIKINNLIKKFQNMIKKIFRICYKNLWLIVMLSLLNNIGFYKNL